MQASGAGPQAVGMRGEVQCGKTQRDQYRTCKFPKRFESGQILVDLRITFMKFIMN